MRRPQQMVEVGLQGVARFIVQETGRYASGPAVLFDGAERSDKRLPVRSNHGSRRIPVRAPAAAVSQHNESRCSGS